MLVTLRSYEKNVEFQNIPFVNLSQGTQNHSGLKLKVVETTLEGDEVKTDLHAMEQAIIEVGESNIVCVVTTTSCFAPRSPDK